MKIPFSDLFYFVFFCVYGFASSSSYTNFSLLLVIALDNVFSNNTLNRHGTRPKLVLNLLEKSLLWCLSSTLLLVVGRRPPCVECWCAIRILPNNRYTRKPIKDFDASVWVERVDKASLEIWNEQNNWFLRNLIDLRALVGCSIEVIWSCFALNWCWLRFKVGFLFRDASSQV